MKEISFFYLDNNHQPAIIQVESEVFKSSQFEELTIDEITKRNLSEIKFNSLDELQKKISELRDAMLVEGEGSESAIQFRELYKAWERVTEVQRAVKLLSEANPNIKYALLQRYNPDYRDYGKGPHWFDIREYMSDVPTTLQEMYRINAKKKTQKKIYYVYIKSAAQG